MFRHPLFLALPVAFLVSGVAVDGQENAELVRVKLPPGFKIEVYASDVPNARSMNRSPSGTVFVASRRAGNVYAVLDRDQDQKADEVITIASGLNTPNGVAFRGGDLYVAELDRVLRYDDIESRLDDAPEPVIVNDTLPSVRTLPRSASGSTRGICSRPSTGTGFSSPSTDRGTAPRRRAIRGIA